MLETDEPYDFRAVGDAHYLALHDMTLLDGELRIDGLPAIARKDLRDTLTFAPRECALDGWAKPSPRQNSYTAFYFDPDEVSDELGARYARAEARPFAYKRDPSLVATMTKLKQLVTMPGADELYGEALCLIAAIEILGIEPQSVSGLTKAQLQNVHEFVAAHLDGPITLDDLARVSSLSRSHFSRAFKASVGIGPHRFVNDWRIRRARDLLEGAAPQPIDAVARAVGFSSAGVFRRVFRQFVGVTPQQYREERR